MTACAAPARSAATGSSANAGRTGPCASDLKLLKLFTLAELGASGRTPDTKPQLMDITGSFSIQGISTSRVTCRCEAHILEGLLLNARAAVVGRCVWHKPWTCPEHARGCARKASCLARFLAVTQEGRQTQPLPRLAAGGRTPLAQRGRCWKQLRTSSGASPTPSLIRRRAGAPPWPSASAAGSSYALRRAPHPPPA